MKKIIAIFTKIFAKGYTTLLVRVTKVSDTCYTVQEYDYDSLDFGRAWGRMWGTMRALPCLLKKLGLTERAFCMFTNEEDANRYKAAYAEYMGRA